MTINIFTKSNNDASHLPGIFDFEMSHLFAANKRNTEFHDLFKNIPQDEILIDSKKLSYQYNFSIFCSGYSCALSREILIHGRLYLSTNYACFNANILGWITNVTRICLLRPINIDQ